MGGSGLEEVGEVGGDLGGFGYWGEGVGERRTG